MWVWLDARFEASTSAPPSAPRFERVAGDGFELHLDRTLPEEGTIGLVLRRFPRRRLVARRPSDAGVFWRGVAVEHHAGDSGGGSS